MNEQDKEDARAALDGLLSAFVWYLLWTACVTSMVYFAVRLSDLPWTPTWLQIAVWLWLITIVGQYWRGLTDGKFHR